MTPVGIADLKGALAPLLLGDWHGDGHTLALPLIEVPVLVALVYVSLAVRPRLFGREQSIHMRSQCDHDP